MCYLANKTWFDAAIDILTGEVRSFLSNNDTACFECGLEDEDYLSMNLRYSCARLLRESLSRGKQPTTPVIASIIAGMQVEQAIRYLHRFEIQPGILHYNGFTGFLHRTSRSLRKDCPAHDRLDHVIECNDLALSSSLQELSDKAKAILGQEAIVEFDREITEYFLCVNCQYTMSVLKPVKQILEDVSVCPNCRMRMRPKTFHKIIGTEKFLTKVLRDLEFPPLHVFRAHNNDNQIFLEATGDLPDLFTASEWHSSS